MSLAISAKNWPNLGQKPFSWLFETIFGNIHCTKHMQTNSDFRHGMALHNPFLTIQCQKFWFRGEIEGDTGVSN